MLVPRSRLAEAEELAARKAESYVLGDPYDPATTLGPVANPTQQQRVRDYIRSGREEGVQLLNGGPEAPEGLERGYFVRPTVFSGDHTSRIAREEIFGPVMLIVPFDSEDEAFDIANDTDYGLGQARSGLGTPTERGPRPKAPRRPYPHQRIAGQSATHRTPDSNCPASAGSSDATASKSSLSTSPSADEDEEKA